jgi:hypothetical protein
MLKWSEGNRLHSRGQRRGRCNITSILKKGCSQPDYRAVEHPFLMQLFYSLRRFIGSHCPQTGNGPAKVC